MEVEGTVYISLYIKYPQISEMKASEILYVEIRKRQLVTSQNSPRAFAYITSSGFCECMCKEESEPYNICFRFGPSRNLSCTKFAAITKGVCEVCSEITHGACRRQIFHTDCKNNGGQASVCTCRTFQKTVLLLHIYKFLRGMQSVICLINFAVKRHSTSASY